MLALTRTISFGRVIRENLAGTTLAGYALQDMVGEGGTAVVYRADHPAHGTVALKVLREKLRTDKTAVARFLREASYGTRVTHPNVVRTIEIGEPRPGVHFLAIEWANGELLEKYAKRNAPLPPAEVADIIEQLAQAVHAVHAEGIVHRDLKPENVMYDPATKKIKLLDFGIAAEPDLTPEERLTKAGFFVGTLMYVAPEALSGQLVTSAADQYSLGTIAYYLLSGNLPYLGKSQREMFTQLLSQPPIPLNSARKGYTVDPAIEAVVMRALSRNPSDRYAHVTEFAAALRAATAAPSANKKEGLFARMKGLIRRDD
ncbi:MAG TPA: serine/threonine-protein kinase [Gemmatimonadaceae bacterium]|nr:serine/threonine-protein kinase [Gemmatimonadaceae bacterium]